MAGSIQHRPERPSPWRARYRGPDGRQHSKSFRRKVDAERWLRDQLGNMDRGSWIEPGAGKVTFGEIAERWMAGRRVRESTKARDESLLRSRILPAFGVRPVGSLTPSDFEEWIADLEGELSPATVRKAWAIAGSVLRLAVRDGLIARTPARDVELPEMDRQDPMFIPAAAILALADEIGPQWRGIVLLGGFGGLRFGEIAGLQVADMDVLRKTVTIRRTVSDVDGRLVVGPPKTRKAIRSITVPRIVTDAIAGAIPEGAKPDAYIFPDSKGGPLARKNWVRRVWTPAVKAVGLDGLTPHDLRHSHVALLIEQGEHPRAIADRLGHTSVRTVLDVYGHLFPEADAGIADRLDERLADPDVAQVWPRETTGTVHRLPATNENPR